MSPGYPWDRPCCSICREPGHNRLTCPKRTPATLPPAQPPPDRFAEYSKASDAVQAARAQLIALEEHTLVKQAEQLFSDIARAYWAHHNKLVK